MSAPANPALASPAPGSVAERPLVLVSETLDERPAQWLTQRAHVVRCAHTDPQFAAHLAQARGLVVRTYTLVNDALLDQAPHLRVVGRGGVGLDNIDVPACRRRGIEVVYTPDANTQAVVEYVLGLVLDVYRPRPILDGPITEQEFHRRRKVQVGRQIQELTLGILGMGRIGKRLGRVGAALGMNVLAHDLLPEAQLRADIAAQSGGGGDYPWRYVDLATLGREADIFTVHIDGRADNRAFINAAVLAHLKPTCLFINAARGFLIDNAALADWAQSHPQATVILDVHEPEPPPSVAGPAPQGYPFYTLPNVRLLPHLASRTHTATENMSWVVRDVWAVLQGERPQCPAPGNG